MPPPVEKRLKLLVRFVDGKWELEFGGDIPVKNGQVAELIVSETAITDQRLVQAMRSKSVINILPRGAKLRVYLATKEFQGVSVEARKQLLEWKNWANEVAPFAVASWSAGPLSFFELELGPPTDKQTGDMFMREGGLWLIIEGRKAKGLQSSQFELPDCVSKVIATSLNHALTILSEVYEPWRISHTGNVYDRFLYQEANGKWYPLSILRDGELAQKDQRIAYGMWQDFMRRMSTRGADLNGS